jgi:thymidylate kinase
LSLHPVLASLFAAWEDAGVAWALLRVPTHPDAPEGDLDLLIDRSKARLAFDLARRAGFVEVPGYEPDTHLVQFHLESRCWLWLHCATELRFGAYGVVRPGCEHACLDARRRDGEVSRLAPGDEFWITLFHALLDQGRLSDNSKRRLTATAPAALPDGPLPRSLSAITPGDWTPARLIERVHAEDWDALLRLAPTLRDRAGRLGRPPLPVRAARRVIRAVFRANLPRRGLSVAILGPDGAGKSTLAAGLAESFVFPVRRIYMGLTGGALRQVDRIRIPGVVRLGRVSVIWSRFLRGSYHAWRGRLVLYDRYTLDAAVPTPHRLSPLARFARWMDGHACPPPDLVLILDAPGDLMYRRKGSYTAEMLEDWRKHFLALEPRLRHVAVLDASQPADMVRAEATDRIWARYAARWGGG